MQKLIEETNNLRALDPVAIPKKTYQKALKLISQDLAAHSQSQLPKLTASSSL